MWKANGLHKTKRLNGLSGYVRHPVLRWTLTLAWTAITASLMLSPSGDGTTVSWVSKLFGGTQTTDAIGHVIINAILAFLWCWTLSLYASTAKTTRLILIGGLVCKAPKVSTNQKWKLSLGFQQQQKRWA